MAPELRSLLFRTLEASVESIWNNTNGTLLPNNWEGPAPRLDEEMLLASQTSALNAILAWTDYVCGGEQFATTAATSTSSSAGATSVSAVGGSTSSALTSTSDIFVTEPPLTSAPSVVLVTWQTIVSMLMAAVIVFVIGGVIVVVILRRRHNRQQRAGELVAAEGFATEAGEDNEDLFEDL